MKIRTMRVNRLKNPLGCECACPVFSWVAEDCAGKRQTRARLLLALDREMKKNVYDSGWQREIQSSGFCPNVQLSPRTRYYWQVQIKTEKKEKGISRPAWFETGKMGELWLGQWIQAGEEPERYPLFRKSFFVPGDTEKGRLYISSLGLHEAYLNGEKISEECLAGLCHKTGDRLEYTAYELDRKLKRGRENTISVLLGEGKEGEEAPPVFLAEIRLESDLGKETCIPSDKSWEWRASPVRENRLEGLERYDARLEEGAWKGKEYEKAVETEGIFGFFEDRLTPPLTVLERFRPVELIPVSREEMILDFGREIRGWVEFECREPEGKTLEIWYQDSLREPEGIRGKMIYVSGEEPGFVRPRFSCYVFRYLRIRGIENAKPGDFTACVLGLRLRRTGWIRTSKKSWNQAIIRAEEAGRGALLEELLGRDQKERGEAFCQAVSFFMETLPYYRGFLERRRREEESGSLPWLLYKQYGNLAVLAETYGILRERAERARTDRKKPLSRRYERLKTAAKAALVLEIEEDFRTYREEILKLKKEERQTVFTEGVSGTDQEKGTLEGEPSREEKDPDGCSCFLDCGLRPAEIGPGWKRAILEPKPDRRLEYAEITYESPGGAYGVSWEWRGEGICFQAAVPFDGKAKFILPQKGKTVKVNGRKSPLLEEKGSIVLPSGSYQIEVS